MEPTIISEFQISQEGSALSWYDFDKSPKGSLEAHESVPGNISPKVGETEDDFQIVAVETHESVPGNISPKVEETEDDFQIVAVGTHESFPGNISPKVEETEDDFQVMAVEFISAMKQSRKPRILWSVKEDEVMLGGLVKIMCDEKKHGKRKSFQFWNRVGDYYNQIRVQRDEDSSVSKSDKLLPREGEQCRQRYRKLSRDCSNWENALREAKSRQKRGLSDADLFEEAQQIYRQRGDGYGNSSKNFTEFYAWKILDELPKLKPDGVDENEVIDGSSSKRSKVNESGDFSASSLLKTLTSDSPTSKVEGNTKAGIECVKALDRELQEMLDIEGEGKTKVNSSIDTQNEHAKALNIASLSRELDVTLQREMLKIEREGKTKVNTGNDTRNEYVEALNRNSLAREQETTLQREMLEIERERESERFQLEREKEARKQRKMDMKLYEMLLRKGYLDPDEEELRKKLVKKLFANY